MSKLLGTTKLWSLEVGTPRHICDLLALEPYPQNTVFKDDIVPPYHLSSVQITIRIHCDSFPFIMISPVIRGDPHQNVPPLFLKGAKQGGLY